MFIIANLIETLAQIINIVINIYIWAIIIRAILSWINPNPYHPFMIFLAKITEPVLGFVRQFIPDLGGIDLSPMLVILVLYFVKDFFVKTLFQVALYLQ
jgi:YggT family protein